MAHRNCDCLPQPPKGMERLTIHMFASKELLDSGAEGVVEMLGEDAKLVAIAATQKRLGYNADKEA